MQGSQRQRLQDQEVQRALQQLGAFSHVGTRWG